MALPGCTAFVKIPTSRGEAVCSTVVVVLALSAERAFVVLPGSAAPALGLEAHLVSVGAVAGANDVDVLGASVLPTGLLLTRPAAWLHWHRFSRLEEMRPAWSHLASLGHSALEEPQPRVDLGRLSALQDLIDRQAATGLPWTALATVAISSAGESGMPEGAEPSDSRGGTSAGAARRPPPPPAATRASAPGARPLGSAIAPLGIPSAATPAVAAAAAVPATGDSSTGALLKLMLIDRLWQEERGHRADGLSDSEGEDRLPPGQDPTMQAFSRHAGRTPGMEPRPERGSRTNKQPVRGEPRVQWDARWTFRLFWDMLPFARHRSIGELTYLMCTLLDELQEEDASGITEPELNLVPLRLRAASEPAAGVRDPKGGGRGSEESGIGAGAAAGGAGERCGWRAGRRGRGSEK